MQGSDQPLYLKDYSSESISLLASRHRLHAEPSQKSSGRTLTDRNEMQEFKQQIEFRFNQSIANKIYTFPKKIETVDDILSSSEDERQQESLSKNRWRGGDNKIQKIHKQLFKKRSQAKGSTSKRKQKLSSSEQNIRTNFPFGNSSWKKKGQIQYIKNTSNTRKAGSKSKEKTNVKIDKTFNKHKQKGKGERLKTEPDAKVMGTIRAKLTKRN